MIAKKGSKLEYLVNLKMWFVPQNL